MTRNTAADARPAAPAPAEREAALEAALRKIVDEQVTRSKAELVAIAALALARHQAQDSQS
jgi:hypothetical protein